MQSHSLAPSGGHGLVNSTYSARGSLSLDHPSESSSSIKHDDLHDPYPLTPPHEPSWSTLPSDLLPAPRPRSVQDLPPGQQQQQQQEEGDEDSAVVHIPVQHYRGLERTAREIMAMCDKLAMARDKAMYLRSQSFYDRQELLLKHKFIFESQTNLTKQLSLSTTAATTTVPEDWMQERQKLEQDYEALLLFDPVARDSESRILQLDYNLRTHENTFKDLVSDFANLLRDCSLAPPGPRAGQEPPSTPDQPIPPTRTASPDIPPALDIYYEKAGAVGWQTDRIHELDHEYKKDCSRRAFRQDKGENLSTTDEDFEADYLYVRSEAEDALQLAIRESSKAKQACLDQGIDPDEYRKPIPDWLEPNLVDRLEQSGTPMIEPKDVDVPTSPTHPGTVGPQNAGVMDWIANTDQNDMYHFDVDTLEQLPSPRSWKSTRRSIHDLRAEPTIKVAAIKEYVPKQFHVEPEPEPEPERTRSQPFLYGRNPRSWSLRLKRQPSDPGMRGSFTRNGLGQNTAFLRTAPLPGGLHPKSHGSLG